MEQKKLLKEKELGVEKEKQKRDRLKYDFSKTEYLYLCEEAMLNDIQKQLLEDKIKGLTIIEMSIKHDLSPETINRYIKKMKNKILKVIGKIS